MEGILLLIKSSTRHVREPRLRCTGIRGPGNSEKGEVMKDPESYQYYVSASETFRTDTLLMRRILHAWRTQ